MIRPVASRAIHGTVATLCDLLAKNELAQRAPREICHRLLVARRGEAKHRAFAETLLPRRVCSTCHRCGWMSDTYLQPDVLPGPTAAGWLACAYLTRRSGRVAGRASSIRSSSASTLACS